MGAYLGVARGSETEPQFIHLTYAPKTKAAAGAARKKIAVVGKGLTFDSGGYNIKVAMMELMKFDMGGSGATLGAARAIAALRPDNVEVHFIVAACENMINDRALRPSDILTASNGKTIEVLNTDAEGRLTLADALVCVYTYRGRGGGGGARGREEEEGRRRRRGRSDRATPPHAPTAARATLLPFATRANFCLA